MADSERLRETLLDLESLRQREQALRIESETLLGGLRVLSQSEDIKTLFHHLTALLRSILDFNEAFILQLRDDGALATLASTSGRLRDTVWHPRAVLNRVLEGKTVAVFDVAQVPEWIEQPIEARAGCKSALHARLYAGRHAVVLIFTHQHPRHFGPVHVKQVERFVPLAAQAFAMLELRRTIVQRDRFFDLSLELMGIAGFDGCFSQINEAWRNTLGYSEETLKEVPLADFVHIEDRRTLLENLDDLEKNGVPRTGEYRFRARDGTYRWLSCSMAAYADERLYYIAARDVTSRVIAERRLERDARHDVLTGLFNRAVFRERLEKDIAHAQRNPLHQFAVMYLDLDRFKVINDSLGHLIGDQLLISIARRLEQAVRDSDVAARIGGDEFIVLLSDIGEPSAAARIAGRLIAMLEEPVNAGGHEVIVSASVGITLSSLGYKAADDMLRDADIAMYAAKTEGKSRYAIFDRAMHAKAVMQLQTEIDLRRALENDEFSLHYQPVVDVRSGAICAFEALVRWRHPERGMISPLEFIPIAEEAGLIIPIGQWVMEEACRQVRAWREKFPHMKDVVVNVNISARQFWQKSFVRRMTDLLRAQRLEPSDVVFEITESVFIHNAKGAVDIFRALKEHGLKICLDDFGTGFSSLSYLRLFPFDGLKIDRSFVSRMESDPTSRELVNTILLLARNLGLQAVAEGVETAGQWGLLRDLDCARAQGYLFSKPVPALEAEALLSRGGFTPCEAHVYNI